MGKVNEWNEFVAEDGSFCSSWTEKDLLVIGIGDDHIRLKGAEELEQFINYICETKLRNIPL